MTLSSLQKRDLAHIWHPCSQMKDYENFPPVEIERAAGSYLYTPSGDKIIDCIASWWCKSLGHAHPDLQAALRTQMATLEHVILANTTNPTLVGLGERLAGLTQTLDKVQFASDGSCAVEMALKMSLHAQSLLGRSHRTGLMALQNGYHGETALTLGVSDLGLYGAPYKAFMPECRFLTELPYVSGRHDPLWHDCSDAWQAILPQLEAAADTLCAIIVEPILQGAGGMRLISADFFKRLRAWTRANDVFLIADEILTGLGRTGLPLACQHSGIEPDFLCLSKSLTSGMLPMSVMLTSTNTYNLFYDDYETGKTFMHSHTQTGNTLAASVAVAVFDVMARENIYEKLPALETALRTGMEDVAEATGVLQNVRGIGGVVAADLVPSDSTSKRFGYAVYQEAIQRGALLRPLGNTIYWLPPLNMTMETLGELTEITAQSVKAVLG